jgi:hypothetical protein
VLDAEGLRILDLAREHQPCSATTARVARSRIASIVPACAARVSASPAVGSPVSVPPSLPNQSLIGT